MKSDSTSKNQQLLHPSSSQNTSTMQDRRQGLEQPLGGILERITHVYLSLDHEWRVTYVNYQVEPVLQKTKEALLGKSLWEAFPEAVGSTFYRRYHEALHRRPSAHFEEFYLSLQKWFEVDIFLSADGIEVHIQDITERKRLEERLQESEKRFRALIEHSADVITLVDPNGTVLYVSPSIQPMLGYKPDELVGQNAFELIHPDDLEATMHVWATIVQEPGKSMAAEFRVQHQDGTLRWIEGIGTNLLADPSVGAIVGNYRDITARKHAEERQRVLEALATTDPVTDLPNHRAVISLLDQELERAQQYERSCSLLFLDLDHFKALNDGYGHTAGNAVLCEFADLVQAQLRRIDTVGRWGGEEFLAILPELQADEALALAKEVQATVATHVFSVGGGIHLTCSVGMASYPVHARKREELLCAADHAMYGAKRFGRNQVRAAHDLAVLTLFSESTPEEGREEAALVGIVEALVTLVEARDHATGCHSQQVADLVLRLACALGLPLSEAQMIALASRLHDVGKVAIPDAVLQKSSPLTQEEWRLMRTHPVVGAEVVSHIPALRPLAPVIRAHHERWDGQGYPDHLEGETIPFGARILAVADAYLTMTVDRPYQKARAPSVALRELYRCAGSQFDPQVVAALAFLPRPPDHGVTTLFPRKIPATVELVRSR